MVRLSPSTLITLVHRVKTITTVPGWGWGERSCCFWSSQKHTINMSKYHSCLIYGFKRSFALIRLHKIFYHKNNLALTFSLIFFLQLMTSQRKPYMVGICSTVQKRAKITSDIIVKTSAT